jgi:phage gp16-like protein
MPKPKLAADAERLRLIRLLHVAKRDLRMVDADYRAVISTASNGAHDSSKDMSNKELEKAISHMKRCGFKVRTKGNSRPDKPTPPRRQADDPEARKIRALWLLLHDLGAVQNPSEAALAAYVKRLTKVDDLHWVNGLQAETLIETLKKWALRFLPAELDRLAPLAKALPLTDADRSNLAAHLHLARTRGTFDPMQSAYQVINDILERAAP